MGENTAIEWATHSFNPWIGCTKVSPGCKYCYAKDNTFTRAQRARGRELWGPRGDRHVTSEAKWAEPAKWNREAERTGIRPRVFPSMCDPFEDRPDLVEPRARFLEIVEQLSNIDWLLLTKRIENVLRMVPVSWQFRFPSNVWIGSSVEDQPRANERIPILARIPASIRFLSAEPLLDRVSVNRALCTCPWFEDAMATRHLLDCIADIRPFRGSQHWPIDWVIIGGESGPGARPFDVSWASELVYECRKAGAAVFVKQLGAVPVMENANCFDWPEATRLVAHGEAAAGARALLRDRKGGDMSEWPSDLRVREFPAAGTLSNA